MLAVQIQIWQAVELNLSYTEEDMLNFERKK